MPVFNAISFVDDAIASILRQSYGDFEFVIVDDGSTDGTHRKLEQWANSDQRIQVVQSEHVGVTDALNLGLAKIHADYVARMDADDIALPERFARHYSPDPGLLWGFDSSEVCDGAWSKHQPLNTQGTPYLSER